MRQANSNARGRLVEPVKGTGRLRLLRVLPVSSCLLVAAAACGGSRNVADTADVAEYEGDEPGECSDRADNDRDGLFDCDDPGCAGGPDCAGADADADAEAGFDPDAGPEADRPEPPDAPDDIPAEAPADGPEDSVVESDRAVVGDAGPDRVPAEDIGPDEVCPEDGSVEDSAPTHDCTVWSDFETVPPHDSCNVWPFDLWLDFYLAWCTDPETAVPECWLPPCGGTIAHDGVRSLMVQGRGVEHRSSEWTPSFTVSMWIYIPTSDLASGTYVLAPCGQFVAAYVGGSEWGRIGSVRWFHDTWILCERQERCEDGTLTIVMRVDGVEASRVTLPTPCADLPGTRPLAQFSPQLSEVSYDPSVPVGPVYVDDYCLTTP
jgi:hypothetical protein